MAMPKESDVIAHVKIAAIDWEIPAKLYEQPIGVGTYQRGGPVHDGTLGSAVREFMVLQGSGVGKVYSIGIESGAIEGLDAGMLMTGVILALAMREDFPNWMD